MTISGREKLYFLLDILDEQRAITPSGSPVFIHVAEHLQNCYPEVDLIQLLTKLEKDEKILRIVRKPTVRDGWGAYDPYGGKEGEYYQIQLLAPFNRYLAKIQLEPEYQKFTGKHPKAIAGEILASLAKPSKALYTEVMVNSPNSENNPSYEDIAYEVSYSDINRKILVNNFLIAQPNFMGENEVVFTYLYKHPNDAISKEQIEITSKTKITKRFSKIIENLGFTGELKKAFFIISKDKIMFRNPITNNVLKELGIEYLRLK